MVTRETAPAVVVLSLACLGGAAALAWFGALGALHLIRNGATVSAVYEDRIFGLYSIARDRIDNIVGVASVPDRFSVRSNPPQQLVFVTTTGPVNRGLSQQRFARSYVEIDSFIRDPSRSEFIVRATYDRAETLRFYSGLLAMLFLVALSVFSLALGIKAMRPEDPRSGIGPV